MIKSEGLIYMVLEYGDIDLARLLQRHEAAQKEGGCTELDENFIRLYWQQMLQARPHPKVLLEYLCLSGHGTSQGRWQRSWLDNRGCSTKDLQYLRMAENKHTVTKCQDDITTRLHKP